MTATPASNYNFVRWTKNGSQVSTNPTYTFTVTESAAYVAHFELQSFTVSVSANPTNGGTVTGGGTFNYGQNCTVTASANQGYNFVNWTEGGNVVSTNANYYFTVTANRTLVANFTLQTVQITANVDPAVGGTASGGGTYNYGDVVTVTVETNEDYAFQNWTENGSVVSEERTYTFTATTNRILVANLMYTEGISEHSSTTLVYPNPVNDKLIVEAQEALGTIEIYNLIGALVYSQKDCTNKVEINTSDLQSGIYFIRLTNDKISETRRFVKE